MMHMSVVPVCRYLRTELTRQQGAGMPRYELTAGELASYRDNGFVLIVSPAPHSRRPLWQRPSPSTSLQTLLEGHPVLTLDRRST